MVIEEARRAFTDLHLFGLRCDAVVINRLLPDAAMHEPFFREWGEVQEERLSEIAETFSPLHVLCAPLGEDEIIGVRRLTAHGENLFHDCAPGALLAEAKPISFHRQDGRYSVEIPLPGATLDALDITKIEGDLLVKTPSVSRSMKLPRRMAALEVSEVHLRGGVLSVFFHREPAVASDQVACAQLRRAPTGA